MNYFEQHVGDTWLEVAELSPVARGIFFSLELLYFRKERPLPNDLPRLQEWCNVRKRTDREILEDVLERCFELGPDGCWHFEAWDEQIAEYQRGEPERAARREAEKVAGADRVRRQREEERRLRAALSDIGQAVPSDVKGVRELRRLAEKHLGAATVAALRTAVANAPAPAAVVPEGGVTPAVTAAVTPVTPPQEPVPISHFPSTPSGLPRPDGGLVVVEGEGETPAETAAVTPAVTALQRTVTAAAALATAGAPVPADDERLQKVVAAGYDAQDVLAFKPAAGFDPEKVRHPGGWLLAAAIKAFSVDGVLQPKPPVTVPMDPAAADPLRKADADAAYARENAEHIRRQAAAARERAGRPLKRREPEQEAA